MPLICFMLLQLLYAWRAFHSLAQVRIPPGKPVEAWGWHALQAFDMCVLQASALV